MSDVFPKETFIDILETVLERVKKASLIEGVAIEMARHNLEPIWVDGQPSGWKGLEPVYYKFEFYLSGEDKE